MGFSGKEKGAAQGGPRAPPPPVRIGQGEGGGAPPFLPLSLLFPPPLLVQQGKGGRPTPGRSRTPTRRGKEVGRERERGAPPPPSPSPIRTRGEEARSPPLAAPLSLSTKADMAHYFSRGCSGNPPALRFSPKSPGTLPVSEYSRPIYQSLCLGHFETPRHVRDHIRDAELPSVHQSIQTHNIDRHRTLSLRTLWVRELCRHDRDISQVNNQ